MSSSSVTSDLWVESSKKAKIKAVASQLYSLVNSISNAVDELRPYLKGKVTDSSYQKLSNNINDLKSVKTKVDEYTNRAGGIINTLRDAMDNMSVPQ